MSVSENQIIVTTESGAPLVVNGQTVTMTPRLAGMLAARPELLEFAHLSAVMAAASAERGGDDPRPFAHIAIATAQIAELVGQFIDSGEPSPASSKVVQ